MVDLAKKKVRYKIRHYHPPDNKLICRPFAKKKQTTGGLHVPDTAQDKQFVVEVVAVAENLKDIYKVGDTLVYGNRYQMMIVDGDDEGLVVLSHPSEVMYRFEDEEGIREETDEEFQDRIEREREEEQAAASIAEERSRLVSLR